MRDTPQPPRSLPDSVRAMCTFLDVPDLEEAYPSEPGPVQKAAPVTKETHGGGDGAAAQAQTAVIAQVVLKAFGQDVISMSVVLPLRRDLRQALSISAWRSSVMLPRSHRSQ